MFNKNTTENNYSVVFLFGLLWNNTVSIYGGIFMKFTLASLNDLDEIMNIERQGFNAAEAGSVKSYRDRIVKLHDTFLTVRNDLNKVIGFVVGPAVNERFIKDDMYETTPNNLSKGGHQLIFTIAIAPDYRGQCIGSKLLSEFEKMARKNNRESIALTCLKNRIPFYEKNGFTNLGVADSTHGDEVWYNMEKIIE